jgi:protein farnesyltransferase subunit beta
MGIVYNCRTRDHYHTCYCLSGLSIAQHGDGLSDPVVYGDKRNLLHATHPAYNIGKDKVEQVTTYFQAKGFQPDTSYMT